MPIHLLKALPVLLAQLAAAPSARPGVGPTGAGAERARLETADSIVAAWVEEGRVPGAVLLVSEGGRVVLDRAHGWAQRLSYGEGQYGAWMTDAPRGALRPLDEAVPMSVGTVFDLASVTKVMATTFAVMLLVDDGAIDVDAPVSTWLPDFRGGGKEAITVRHLLTHRSGLVQWLPLYYHASNADEAYAYIRDLPLGWPVGEGRHYSDLGFMLLGRIVEKVSGRTEDAFLRERLYGPLGLRTTGYRHATPGGGGNGLAPARAGAFAATSHGNPYEYRMVHDSTFGYRVEGDADAWNGWRHRTLVGEVNDGNAFHAFGGRAGPRRALLRRLGPARAAAAPAGHGGARRAGATCGRHGRQLPRAHRRRAGARVAGAGLRAARGASRTPASRAPGCWVCRPAGSRWCC